MKRNIISSFGIIILFVVVVILSIIGAKFDGTDLSATLSFLPLGFIFIIASVGMLVGAVYLGVTEHDIGAAFMFGLMGLIFAPMTIFAEIKLTQSVLEEIRRIKKK